MVSGVWNMAKKEKQFVFNLGHSKLDSQLLNTIKKNFTEIVEGFIRSKQIDAIKLNAIIQGKNVYLKSKDILPPQKPEEFTKEKLIYPILKDLLEYSDLVKEAFIDKKFALNNRKDKYKFPDYKSSKNNGVLIEAEPIGKDLRNIQNSGINQVYEWLDSIQTKEEVGIATNGIQWILVYKDSKNNMLTEIKSINLKDAFLKINSEVNKSQLLLEPEKNIDQLIEEFYLTFSSSNIMETIEYHSDLIKEQKENITDKFYKELLNCVFGYVEKGKELIKVSGTDYLTASINPESATQNDKNKFGIIFLNRLIFIKFLENKKVLKTRNYLSEMWKNYEQLFFTGEQTYYKVELSPLFYGILNTPPKDRADRRHDDIPYLNGGLFRETVANEKSYDIRNEAVKKIIDLLDQYNFELKENGTNLGTKINADILGSIYEKTVNIITGGFKKLEGAYYTPDEITIYISNQTLFPYLLKKFKDKLRELGWKEKQLDQYKSVADLINYKVTSDSKTWIEFIKIIENTKILDPSCGSGHFLMSALDVLVKIKREIYKILGDKKSDFDLKSEIILNNLFGVDIDPMAIEIAKLRLWLSLIESMDINNKGNKDMLPNIEYNIIQGDSLIGLSSLDEIKESVRNDYSKLNEDILTYKEKLEKYKNNTVEDIPSLRDELKEALDQINRELEPFYIVNPEYQSSKNLNVHWPIAFSSVFLRDNPGFDIVIGNPPYGNILDETRKKIIVLKYNMLRGSSISEVAGIFTYRFTDLLREDGYLSFIITFSITFNKALSIVREHLKNKFKAIYISTFDRDVCKVFSSMTQSVSILLCNEKADKGGIFYTSKFYRTMPQLTNIRYQYANDLLLSNKGFNDDFSEEHRLPKLGEEINTRLLKKIISQPHSLDDLIKYNGTKVTIYLRISGNFWYNAWNFKPYTGTQIKEMRVPLKYQNFILVLINSNLMYFFLRIYGDGRHLNADIMNSIGIPEVDQIDLKLRELDDMAKKLMNDLRSVFDQVNNRFEVSKVKTTINNCDALLRDLYKLSDEEYTHLTKYDIEIRG